MSEQGAPEKNPLLDDSVSFDDFYNALPQSRREEYERRVMGAAYEQFNKGLETEYGDLLPLVVDAKSDPELRKKIARLKDKNVRELFDAALSTFDHVSEPAQHGNDNDPLKEKVTQLEQRQAQEEQRRQWDTYNAARDKEFLALENEYPQLRGNAKLGQHIREISEARTMRNLQNGKAQAVPFKEVYDEWKTLASAEPPPAAPATSQAGAPERPQAPRTAQEGRDKALTILRNAGGLSRLQETLSARGRS